MIVGICGLSESGKSAAGDILVKAHDYVDVAFGDALKRILMDVFDFSEEQLWGSTKNATDGRYPREHTLDNDGVCLCCGLEIAEISHNSEPCYLTPRYAMKTLGTEWGRECYSNVWVEHTMREVQKLLNDGYYYPSPREGLQYDHHHLHKYKGVVIPDVRFKSEMAGIKKAGGKLVRILRPGHLHPKWDHPSETEQLDVPDDQFDYIMHNNGTLEDLALKVENMTMVWEAE